MLKINLHFNSRLKRRAETKTEGDTAMMAKRAWIEWRFLIEFQLDGRSHWRLERWAEAKATYFAASRAQERATGGGLLGPKSRLMQCGD